MSDTDVSSRLRPWRGQATFDPNVAHRRLGVSGGADSLALLALAASTEASVTAVYVDHGQRDGDRDLAVVDAAARAVGAAVETARIDVEAGPNLEARMRAARYSILGASAATGHTADDQAETVLINLLRGSGLRGLGAMQPGPRRPILGLRRSDTEAICAAMGWSPVIDPTNDDGRFVRNRIRHEVLPLLADIAGRDVVPLLCRTASHARSGADYIDGVASELDAADAKALHAAPDAVAAAAVAAWVRGATGAEHPPDAGSIERILDVAAGRHIAAEVAGGWRVSRSRQRLTIS